jgi:hypothetical protein
LLDSDDLGVVEAEKQRIKDMTAYVTILDGEVVYRQ